FLGIVDVLGDLDVFGIVDALVDLDILGRVDVGGDVDRLVDGDVLGVVDSVGDRHRLVDVYVVLDVGRLVDVHIVFDVGRDRAVDDHRAVVDDRMARILGAAQIRDTGDVPKMTHLAGLGGERTDHKAGACQHGGQEFRGLMRHWVDSFVPS